MAKGFTVKAKSPVKKTAEKKPEFDYAKAKEMIKGKLKDSYRKAKGKLRDS